MNLKCQQKELIKALNTCIRAVNTTNTLPILNNLLLTAEKDRLTISATNLEIAIVNKCLAEVKNEGSLTIPAKLLTNYVSFLKDDLVDLETTDNVNMNIKTPGSKTILKGLSSEDFPSIPTVEQDFSFKIKKPDLLEALNLVVFAASVNKSRPILTGVFFEIKDSQLKIVATDSYRLSEKYIGLEGGGTGEKNFIIPAKSIIELSKIMLGDDEIIEVVVSKTQVLFKIGETQLISRLIDGQYPDYQQIVPQKPITQICVGLNDLVLAIKRINLFARENSNNIKLKIGTDSKLILTTAETQLGSGEENLDISLKGDNNKIALNSEFLLDIFSHLNTPEIILELDSSLTPVIIKIPEEKSFLHIIMPLKL